MESPAEYSRTDPFLCGVVEGFYGRPWTNQQRGELFQRMGSLGMNVYMYAPKDDLKHRAQWRDKYTPEEADCLQLLIQSCTVAKVNFVYALSPGIDIEYSNPREIKALKQKFDQVRSLGCSAFALLFDDIEHHMVEADRKKFGTFAAAQVAVTNDVYEYLGCPLFLFCPTEYCESRAMPTLETSNYLDTVGRKLRPKIHIFWTGPRVISRLLTANHCSRVSRIFRRPCLIWDNLHANDYDQRRVYLGPYAGRHVNAKQYMSGVLTNPNCEFEANFVAVATLAHWAKCDEDTEIGDSVVSADDARLEAGDEQSVATTLTQMAEPVNTYHPLGSLRKAVQYWANTLQSNVNASLPFSSLASYAATQTTSSAPMMEFPNPGQTTVISSVTGPLPAYTPNDIMQSIMTPGVDPPLIERHNSKMDNQPATTDSAMDTVINSISEEPPSSACLPVVVILHVYVDESHMPTTSQQSTGVFAVSQALRVLGHTLQYRLADTPVTTNLVCVPTTVLHSGGTSTLGRYWTLVEHLIRLDHVRPNQHQKYVCFVHDGNNNSASQQHQQPFSCGCGDVAVLDASQVPIPDGVTVSDVFNEFNKEWRPNADTDQVLAVMAAVLHELGHCFGLAHTNTGIMSDSYVTAITQYVMQCQQANRNMAVSSYNAATTSTSRFALLDPNSIRWMEVKMRCGNDTEVDKCVARTSGDEWNRMLHCSHAIEIVELRVQSRRLASWDMMTDGMAPVMAWSVPKWIMEQYPTASICLLCVHAHQHVLSVSPKAKTSNPPVEGSPVTINNPLPVAFETQMSTGQTFNSLTNDFTQTAVNIVEPSLQHDVIGTPASSENAANNDTASSDTQSQSGFGGGHNVLSSITPISATLVQATSLPITGETTDAATVNKSIAAAVAASEPMDATNTHQQQQQLQQQQMQSYSSEATLIRPNTLLSARSTDSLTMLVDEPDQKTSNTSPPPVSAVTPKQSVSDKSEKEPKSSSVVNNGAAGDTTANSTGSSTEIQQRTPRTGQTPQAIQVFAKGILSPDLLSLLIDLFYLPFEHGARAKLFIGEFSFLKSNAHVLSVERETPDGDKDEEYSRQLVTTAEWHRRARVFHGMCADVDQLYMDIVSLCTSSFLVDFYPYIYEMQQIVAMLDGFVQWMAIGCLEPAAAVPASSSAASNGVAPTTRTILDRTESTESVDSQEVEPWVYRGGLISDLHRLLLTEQVARDIFAIRPPYAPLCRVLRVRPATEDDKSAMFALCAKIFSQCLAGQPFEQHPDFMCDYFVSSYLCSSLNNSFVIEECCRSSADPHLPTGDIKIVGCSLSALSGSAFVDACRKSYVPELLSRYADVKASMEGESVDAEYQFSMISPQSLLNLVRLGAWPNALPEKVCDGRASSMQMFIQDEYRESPAPKMLLACTMAALHVNGSTAISVDCLSPHRAQQEMLAKLGFQYYTPDMFSVTEQQQAVGNAQAQAASAMPPPLPLSGTPVNNNVHSSSSEGGSSCTSHSLVNQLLLRMVRTM